MFKVLVVDDEPQIREVFELILEANDNIEVLFAPSGNQAIKLLQEYDDIGFIFCDYRMDDGNGGEVFQWVFAHRPQAAFTLVSTYEPSSLPEFENFTTKPELYRYITKPFRAEDILKLTDDWVNSSNKSSDYSQMKFTTLLEFVGKIKADVFIKIHDDKMVKIIASDDEIDASILKRYIQKKMIWGYVSRNVARAIMDIKIESSFEILSHFSKANTFEKKGNLLIDSLDNAREIICSLGAEPQVVKITEQIMLSTLQFIEETKGLVDLLELMSKRNSYISNQGLLSAYIAISLILKLEWDTANVKEKVSTACLFQNISLETEELAKIYSTIEDGFTKLDIRDQKITIEHPRHSAEIINAKSFFDSDITNLILHHHELPNGSGFPKGLNSTELGQMDAVVALSCHLATDLMNDRSREVTLLAQDFNEIYNDGIFKKVYHALLQVFAEMVA